PPSPRLGSPPPPEGPYPFKNGFKYVSLPFRSEQARPRCSRCTLFDLVGPFQSPDEAVDKGVERGLQPVALRCPKNPPRDRLDLRLPPPLDVLEHARPVLARAAGDLQGRLRRLPVRHVVALRAGDRGGLRHDR